MPVDHLKKRPCTRRNCAHLNELNARFCALCGEQLSNLTESNPVEFNDLPKPATRQRIDGTSPRSGNWPETLVYLIALMVSAALLWFVTRV